MVPAKPEKVPVESPAFVEVVGINGDVRKPDDGRTFGFVRRGQRKSADEQGGQSVSLVLDIIYFLPVAKPKSGQGWRLFLVAG